MDLDQLKKQTSRATEQLKILTHIPEFKKDIKKLRKKWHIPENGLPDNDQMANWQKSMIDKSQKFLEEKVLSKSNKELVDKNIIKQEPINTFNADIDKILKKYKKPPSVSLLQSLIKLH